MFVRSLAALAFLCTLALAQVDNPGVNSTGDGLNNPGTSNVGGSSGNDNPVPQVSQFFARLASPPNTRDAGCYSNEIISLVSSNVWPKLSGLYDFDAADSTRALINLVSSNYTATTSGTPSYAQYIGFNGDAVSAFIDTNFNPVTAADPNFTLNSETVFFSSPYQLFNNSSLLVGSDGGNSTAREQAAARNNSAGPVSDSFYRIGDATTQAVPADTSENVGFFSATRTGLTSKSLAFNGATIDSQATLSTALTSANIHFLDNGVPQFSNGAVSIAGFGAGLTPTDQANLFKAAYGYLACTGLATPPFPGKGAGIYFWPNQILSAGNVFQYEKNVPWTWIQTIRLGPYVIPGAGYTAFAQILFTNVEPANPQPGIEMYVETTSGNTVGNIVLQVLDNTAVTFKSAAVKGGTNVLDGQVHVVAGSYDGSGLAAGMSIVIDGTPETLTVKQDNLTGSSVSIEPFYIGNQHGVGTGLNNWPEQFWPRGGFGYVQFSNVVRSLAYIRTATISAPPVKDANTQLEYLFTEGTGQTTADTSGNGITGTFLDKPQWIPH